MNIDRIGFAYNPTKEAALELLERAEGWCRAQEIAHWSAPAGECKTLVEQLPGTGALVVLGRRRRRPAARREPGQGRVPLEG